MKQEILANIPLAKALEGLLYPYAEIVIHELEHQTIAAIFNNFSKRKVGDDSSLEKENEYPDFFEPYYKTNWDGRRLKCTTATIRNSKGKAVALFCINLDVSKLEEFKHLVNAFTQQPSIELPGQLFNEDWREKISLFVNDYIKSKSTSLKNLTKDEKKHLVLKLHQEGAFRAKNAASYVGDVLDISRATVYKYLAEVHS